MVRSMHRPLPDVSMGKGTKGQGANAVTVDTDEILSSLNESAYALLLLHLREPGSTVLSDESSRVIMVLVMIAKGHLGESCSRGMLHDQGNYLNTEEG